VISTWTEDGFEIVYPAVIKTAACVLVWCPRVLLQAAADPNILTDGLLLPPLPAVLHNFEGANLKDSGRAAACQAKNRA